MYSRGDRMKTISIRLNEEEERAFSAYANLIGEPLSTLFKRTLEEKLEDEFDIKIAEDFVNKQSQGQVKSRPIEELFEELDL